MDLRWVSAFVDRPREGSAAIADFWGAASDSTLSPWRGDDDQFATLQPAVGDAHLRLQRTQGSSGSHIDLHVTDVDAGAEQCVALGASRLADHGGYVVLATPTGMPFCLVDHQGERHRQAPVASGGTEARTLVDQVCVDVDRDGFDDEVRFWSAITGWPPISARAPEFVPLDRPPTMPLRLMFQRRATAVGATSCHLDLACDDVVATAAAHELLGASVVARHRYWTVMTDPANVKYCLTLRSPDTGSLLPSA